MRGYSKRESNVHSARVAFHRRVDKLFHFREGDDLIKLAIDFGLAHAEYGAVEVYIITTGQCGVKAGAHVEERTDAPIDLRESARGFRNPGEDFEKCALPSSVMTNDSDDFATFDFERDVVQRPDVGVIDSRSIATKGRGDRIRDHVAECLVLLLRSEAIAFADVFATNDDLRHPPYTTSANSCSMRRK